jgi:hypothetical protein
MNSFRPPLCSPPELKGDAPAYMRTGVRLQFALCTAPASAYLKDFFLSLRILPVIGIKYDLLEFQRLHER